MSRIVRWNESTSLTQTAAAELIREFDWSDWLVSPAQIDTSEWVITPLGADNTLEFDDDEIDTGGAITRLLLSGGAAGSTYRLTNTVTTNESPAQKQDRSVLVRIT